MLLVKEHPETGEIKVLRGIYNEEDLQECIAILDVEYADDDSVYISIIHDGLRTGDYSSPAA